MPEADVTVHIVICIWEHQDAYVVSEAIHAGDCLGKSLSKTPRQLVVR